MPAPIRTVPAAAAVALAALAGPAAGAPPARVVADQLGLVRQVSLGEKRIAWTRCVTPAGPTEVWTALRRGGPPRRVPGIRVAGDCEPVRIVGVFRDTVVTLITGRSGLRRLDVVDARTGRRTLLEAETAPASGHRITGADTEGPRVVWQREVGAGDERVSETVVGDLRSPRAGLYGGAPRRVVRTRSVRFDAVVPNGAWVSPQGSVVVREAIAGAQYGYGLGAQRAMLVTPTGLRQYARVAQGARISGIDVIRRFLAYGVANPDTGQAWVYVLDRETGSRRLVRRLRALPASVPREVPAVPAPAAHGRFVAWRERIRVARGFADRVLAYDVGRRRIAAVASVPDTRGQRAFVAPPSVRSGQVLWAEVTLPAPAGAVGGYYGVAPEGSRSRILLRRVR